MTVTFRPLIALGLSATLALPIVAQAAEPEDAIHYRQSALSVMGWQMGPMGAMAKGDMEYDEEAFATRANNLAAVAHLPWEGFMEGTLRGDGHGVETGALAKIGDDWAGFEERQKTFEQEAATLAQMVKDGEAFSALRAQVGAVGKSCKGCHDDYRAE
ncbi:c-type cytochrome [Halomonas marinisediminis]|uniref:Cytochrome c n=1 Tax=Halomonas marinisediminis TaxID=2546095 RepID=A0ABY2DB16_9GAMM|nr:cytochrome c [Halomonas marinisediminis]TDB05494.1 cytochrome c [Halomonas marinisediminis]